MEAETGNQEPGTGNQEPGTRNREPGTGKRVPGTNLTFIFIDYDEISSVYNGAGKALVNLTEVKQKLK